MIGFFPTYSSGGGGTTPGLSEVLAVSNRELRYIDDEHYFEAGDETKEIILNGLPENPVNLYLVTETLPLESELIINAFKTGGFLNYGDDEVRYSYNGTITQNGDAPIEIPLGAKCIVRNVVDEDYFFVSIEKISPAEPLYEILNAGDRTLNATFGDVLPVEVPSITLYGNSKNDHIVFTDETLLNDLLVFINYDLHAENQGGVLKITNASNHSIELRPDDGVTLLADTLFIPKNATAIIKNIYQNDGPGEYNIATFTVTYEVSGVQIDIFSTDEKIVGKWINDKPIYQKTIKVLNASLPEYDLILADYFDDIDEICPNCSLFTDWTGENSQKFFGLIGDQIYAILTTIKLAYFNLSNSTPYFMQNLDSVTLTLNYTKTTD